MCLACIRGRVDITEGVTKQITVYFCRGCERYSQPPTQWLPCALESKELLALCLKRIKGLNRVRLVDACFLWTEPHSKRLKVRVTVQKEVFAATILQQTFEVEVIVGGQQCPDCARVEAKNTWNTVVQVRQKVDHKRTFLYLEQLILKHHAHKDVLNIKSASDGLDFFFPSRSHAGRFADFLAAVAPVRSKLSEQLITQDVHSGDSTYKFTISVEIVPLCKDDLIFLPPRVARAFGGISPLVLCTRVGTLLHLLDPNTLQSAELATALYWREPFGSLATSRHLVAFFVLDVEPGRQDGRLCLADVQVAKAADFGRTSQTFFARTHLGHVLRPGDMVLGYDLATSNFNNTDLDQYRGRTSLPDVVLVRKTYAHLSTGRRRNWTLRELDKAEDENMTKADRERLEQDHERFMQDLEEEPELRAGINLFRDPHAVAPLHTDDDDQVPRVPLEELLDGLTLDVGLATGQDDVEMDRRRL